MQPACGCTAASGWNTSMLHANTERLIDYWRERKRGRLSPLRSAIEPGELSGLLPQVFMLGRMGPAHYEFRLAGGQVNALLGRDLKGADALSLWTEADRPRLGVALEACRRAVEPIVAVAEARSPKGAASVELMFAPLVADAEPFDRVIGLCQPLTSMEPLRDLPAELRLRHIASAAERIASPKLRLAAIDGRRIA